MPFVEADKQEVLDLVKSSLNEVIAPILEEMQRNTTKQIDGIAAKLKKQLATTIKGIDEKINPLLESREGDENIDSPLQPNQQQSIPEKNEPNPLEEKLKALEQQLDQEKQERLNLLTQQQLDLQKGDVIRGLNGKVIDPSAFFTLALNEGLIKQGQNGDKTYYYVEKKDALGDMQPIAINSEDGMAIAFELVKTRYPYLEPAREGNGAGVSPAQNQPSPRTELLQSSNLVDALVNGKEEQFFAELNNLTQG